MRKIFQFYLLMFLGFSLWNSALAETIKLTVAVVPQFTPTQIHHDWTPVLSRLEQATGYRFQLLAYDEFPRFESEFKKGIPDLVFMNPYHMVVAKKKQGYIPLIRDKTPLSGVLVVRQDSQVKALADLNGKTISFPSPNALGASLYMRALLTENNHVTFTPTYAGSHQNVYRQVLLGEAAAGGGVRKTLEKESESVQSQLRVLFSTPELAPHPLAVHPRVSVATRNKISDALLAMGIDPAAQPLLAAIQMPAPISADYKKDYSILEKLKLERYVVDSATK